jgi:hypothetical protein
MQPVEPKQGQAEKSSRVNPSEIQSRDPSENCQPSENLVLPERKFAIRVKTCFTRVKVDFCRLKDGFPECKLFYRTES